MTKYYKLLTKEDFLNELYSLVMNPNIKDSEREIYYNAKKLIESDNEYYEAVLTQTSSALFQIALKEKISKEGKNFLSEISRFTLIM